MANHQADTSPHNVSPSSSDTSQASCFSPLSSNGFPSFFSETRSELSRQFHYRSPKLISDELQTGLQELPNARTVSDQLRLVCSVLTHTLSVSFAAAALFKPDFSIHRAHFHSLEASDAQCAAFLEHLSQPAERLREFYDALAQQKKYRFQNAYCFEKHDVETTLGALCLPLPFVEILPATIAVKDSLANKPVALRESARQKSAHASTASALRKIPLGSMRNGMHHIRQRQPTV